MARIRTIKPEHWNDKLLVEISLQAHLFWIGTWNFSDDEGIFEADPYLLRSQIFPRRTDIRIEQVELWIGQLVKARYIVPFTFNSVGYFISRTFKTHQRIDKPAPSKIPSDIIRGVFQDHSKNVPGSFAPESSVLVEEGRIEESRPLPPKNEDELIYNAEEEVLKNRIQFEKILMTATKKDEAAARISLHKYHLWLTEKDRYPMKRKAIYAGFEKWLMNENQPNGTSQSGNSKSGKQGTSEARTDAARNF